MGIGKSRFTGPLGLLLLIGWMVMGLVETAGAAALFRVWWGWGLPIGLPVGFVVAQIPVIGTAAGIAGAVVGWKFSWFLAVGIYVGPYLVLGSIYLIGRRKIRKKTDRMPIDGPV